MQQLRFKSVLQTHRGARQCDTLGSAACIEAAGQHARAPDRISSPPAASHVAAQLSGSAAACWSSSGTVNATVLHHTQQARSQVLPHVGVAVLAQALVVEAVAAATEWNN